MITITMSLESIREGIGLPIEKWKLGLNESGATGDEKVWFAERSALLKFDGLLKAIESEFTKYAFKANTEMSLRQNQKSARPDASASGPLI